MKTLSKFAGVSGHRLWLVTIATALAFGIVPLCWGGVSDQTNQTSAASSEPWQANQLIKPNELAKSLSPSTGEKPLVICVAYPVLYDGGHIVGAKFAGPAAKPQGIQALKDAVEGLPRDKQIVLYCGCCPWEKCPNVRAAFRAMQGWGFMNVKALYLPTDFRQDWIAKSFPIEKGGGQQ